MDDKDKDNLAITIIEFREQLRNVVREHRTDHDKIIMKIDGVCENLEAAMHKLSIHDDETRKVNQEVLPLATSANKFVIAITGFKSVIDFIRTWAVPAALIWIFTELYFMKAVGVLDKLGGS